MRKIFVIDLKSESTTLYCTRGESAVVEIVKSSRVGNMNAKLLLSKVDNSSKMNNFIFGIFVQNESSKKLKFLLI